MLKDNQFDLLLEVLRKFQSAGLLNEVMLIGSWCLLFYRHEFKGADTWPALRTLDADFLIPNPKKIFKDVNIPSLLKELGFVSTHNRLNNLIVYDHPELRVEFLVPEMGRGTSDAQSIPNLHIKAQGFRK